MEGCRSAPKKAASMKLAETTVASLKPRGLKLACAVAFALLLGLFCWPATAHAQGSVQVSGTVADSNAQGVQGVSVYATDLGGTTTEFGPVTTGQDGSYALSLDPGTYDIHFDPPSGSTLGPIVDSDVSVAGDQIINVQLTPILHSFSGTITNADGSPAAQVFVGLGVNFGGTTDAGGDFKVVATPGTYSVRIGRDDASSADALPPGFSVPAGSFDLSGSDVTQDFRLPPVTTLTVMTDDANGSPVAGVPITSSVFTGQAAIVPGGAAVSGSSVGGAVSTDGTGQAVMNVFQNFTAAPGQICARYPVGGTVCNTNPVPTGTGPATLIFQSTFVSIPDAPSGLAIVSPAHDPALSWNAVTGAASYNIYRDGVKLDSSTANSYTDIIATEGTHSYYVTAVDAGGESAPSNIVSVLVDRTPPVISYSLSPAPNGSGWNNSQVTVTFTCTDNAGGAGASVTAAVSIDQTPPEITAAASPAPNGTGWNNTPVTVTYACADALSGVASCPGPVTEPADGTYTLTGTAADKAGNTSAAVTTAVDLDTTPPVASNAAFSTDPKSVAQPAGTLTAQVFDPVVGSTSSGIAGAQ
jgi:hypothetical protein